MLSEITEIELWRDDAGLNSSWFCDRIFCWIWKQVYNYHETLSNS